MHQQWLIQRADRKMVVIEIGAGKAVPTVRMNCEAIAAKMGGKLIRINVRDSEIPRGNVSLPIGGLEALQRIDAMLEEMR